jgi:serine/threonine-protein kinase RsbW
MASASQSRLAIRVHEGAMREMDQFVVSFAARHGLAADDTDRILILLEELFTNLWRYGYPHKDDRGGSAEIALELSGEWLTIEFVDDGQAFDPLEVALADPEQSIKDKRVGGLGLHLVRKLAEEASYTRRDGRNFLRLSRRVSLSRSST